MTTLRLSPLRTPLCEQLDIAVPIVLAGMGGVSMAPLVAAVSNAGGLGVLGAANLSPEGLRAEIRRARTLTARPFGVDLLAPVAEMIEPYLPVLFDEGVRIFVAGLAVPERHIAEMRRRGMRVVVMCGKVSHALRAERAGADVVVAQGTEAGGHTGEIGTMALVPQIVDAVRVPVLAAGGIVDGRGVLAALALGAQGVVMGTRFIATREATAAVEYQQALIRAQQDDTVRTRCYTGKPLRTLKNHYVAEWETSGQATAPFPNQLLVSVQQGVLGYWEEHVDPARACMPAGQGVGAFRDIQPAGDVVRMVVAHAEALLREGFLATAARAAQTV